MVEVHDEDSDTDGEVLAAPGDSAEEEAGQAATTGQLLGPRAPMRRRSMRRSCGRWRQSRRSPRRSPGLLTAMEGELPAYLAAAAGASFDHGDVKAFTEAVLFW